MRADLCRAIYYDRSWLLDSKMLANLMGNVESCYAHTFIQLRTFGEPECPRLQLRLSNIPYLLGLSIDAGCLVR